MQRFIRLFLILSSICLGHCQKPVELPTANPGIFYQFATVDELSNFLKWSPTCQPLVSAHRGSPAPGYPENCIATFENSFSKVPCIFECDIRMTSDSVLVLLHDDELEYTTTGTGFLSEITFAESQELKLKERGGEATDYRIPTLKETFDWARDKTILQLDIKEKVAFADVVAFVEQEQAEHFVIVIAYTLDAVQEIHRLNPDLMISATARNPEEVQWLLDSGIPTNRLLAFVGISEPTQATYDRLHQNGIRSILGVIGNLDHKAAQKGVKVYRELMANGADVFATDNVELVYRAIRPD